MNPLRRALALALLSAAAVPVIASAHSLEELQQDLYERERYFQPKDEPAPSFVLQDADGDPVELADLQGKVVVLYFIYAGCPDICPLHSARIAEVQEAVNATPMKDRVQFVAVTTDPVGDTPAVLSAHSEAHGLDRQNWVFLTSGPDQPEDTTRKLAEEFGHSFSVTNDDYQVHGIVTHVIDPAGVWAANFHGLGFDPTNFVIYVNALVNDHQSHGEAAPAGPWGRLRALFRT